MVQTCRKLVNPSGAGFKALWLNGKMHESWYVKVVDFSKPPFFSEGLIFVQHKPRSQTFNPRNQPTHHTVYVFGHTNFCGDSEVGYPP